MPLWMEMRVSGGRQIDPRKQFRQSAEGGLETGSMDGVAWEDHLEEVPGREDLEGRLVMCQKLVTASW